MHRNACLAVALFVAATGAAEAETVSRSYSYFSIGGATLSEIAAELGRRGPRLDSTGQRHPGATRMEFNTKVDYGELDGRCQVLDARVELKAEVFLPRWRRNGRADAATRRVWEALAADIKRHEETHVRIARDHAREIERSLKRLGRFRDCRAAEAAAQERTGRVLEKHDRAQARFDQAESRNFQSRLMQLMRKRAPQDGG